jgi:putative ABC transport system ATP-binding protein
MTAAEPVATRPAASGGGDIELHSVSRTYQTDAEVQIRALRDITLTIVGGERVAVMAPSGAGKSTLLHVIGAMDRPDEGRIVVAGQEITAMTRKELVGYRRTVGFAFQRFHLIPVLSALDNVLAPVMPYRTDYDKVDRARELLDMVGHVDRADSIPARLSGGQQQRVAIARALINRPHVLLADEPTGNLDSATGHDIMSLLVDIGEELGTTVVLATHDHAVAQYCGRVLGLLDGRLVSDSIPQL